MSGKRLKPHLRESFNESVKARQAEVTSGMQPRAAVGHIDDWKETHLSWRFNRIDVDFQREHHRMDAAGIIQDVLPTLRELDRFTWHQLEGLTFKDKAFKGMHYPIKCQSLSKEATDRLEELHLNVDELWRFRLGQAKRFWGIRVDGVCFFLWLDPEHRVCPSSAA